MLLVSQSSATSTRPSKENGCVSSSTEKLLLRELVGILQAVHIPNLLRTRSLENELANLTSCRPNRTMCGNASNVIDAHQNTVQTSIRAKPHTMLAYTWVMYMALFNGGRTIRAQLLAAPHSFWQSSRTPSNSEESADVIRSDRLQFWDLGDGKDGGNIKEDLKKRFDTAAAQLTASERVDVVDEAVRIYEMLHELVGWLDANASPKGRA
jgi:heme oxygenase